jgi:NAD(P)-dependent dehydrogenase (short-subunit alcohol dehydrogenase family)
MASKVAYKGVAIVTGSSRGMWVYSLHIIEQLTEIADRNRGRAIALRLARDGFDICVNDIRDAGVRSAVKEIESAGGKATGLVADVSKHSEVQKLVDHTVNTFGSLKVMVANAGISKVKPILEQTEQDVREMMDINFMGVRDMFASTKRSSKHEACRSSIAIPSPRSK